MDLQILWKNCWLGPQLKHVEVFQIQEVLRASGHCLQDIFTYISCQVERMLFTVPFVANTIESQGRMACPRQRESAWSLYAVVLLFLRTRCYFLVPVLPVTQLGIVEVFIVSLMVKNYSALHFSTESFEDKPLHDLGKLSELSLKLREIKSVTGGSQMAWVLSQIWLRPNQVIVTLRANKRIMLRILHSSPKSRFPKNT